jgi:hypothetical protein
LGFNPPYLNPVSNPVQQDRVLVLYLITEFKPSFKPGFDPSSFKIGLFQVKTLKAKGGKYAANLWLHLYDFKTPHRQGRLAG